jgi:hypothetical protein
VWPTRAGHGCGYHWGAGAGPGYGYPHPDPLPALGFGRVKGYAAEFYHVTTVQYF